MKINHEYFKINFDSKMHEYFVEDKKVNSVTQILEMAGVTNQFNKNEEARLRGTVVHEDTCLIDNSKLDLKHIEEEYLPFINAYLQFKNDYPHKIIEQELIVYSDCYKFIGTLDRVIERNNKLELYDIATGGLDISKSLQTAGYQIAYEEMTGRRITKRFGLQLKSNSCYSMVHYKEKTDKNVFLGILAGVNWRINNNRVFKKEMLNEQQS